MPDQDKQGSIKTGNIIDSIVAIGHGASVVINRIFPKSERETLEQRNRRVMLGKVRSFWVEGVLEKSLHGAALIELGMEYKPDAVQYPWESILQQPDCQPQAIPRGVKMLDVFNQAGGELLILGAPGSGKTTLLLDLARDLLAQAELDDTLPIPVVFNLSSWAKKRPPLAEWLVDELSFRYNVPRKFGKNWVEQNNLLLLLDGLDEVKAKHRTTCVEAINRYRQEHGLARLAVCSRSAEYGALRAQLRLQSAIVLQPLVRKQIDAYLQSAGEQLTSVRMLLERDAVLQELVESPLMLSIMVLAYASQDVDNLPTLDSAEKRRMHLFDTYIQRMFERRGADKRYSLPQVIHWLAWLACLMVRGNETEFSLKLTRNASPVMYLSQSQYPLYLFGVISASGLAYGLSLGFVWGLVYGWANWLVIGLTLVLFFFI